MTYDLIIRGGRVLDPSQNIDQVMDIGISAGKIAALNLAADSQASQVLDANGKLVTAGLIDLHAHVSRDLVSLAVDPDEAGISAGVTALCDAGSTGYLHFHPFRKYVIQPAKTDVFAFLNISPFGEVLLPEVGFELIDEAAFLEVIEANRDVIRGIKVRAIAELIYATKVDVMAKAVRIARKAGLPIMVHMGMGFEEPVPADEIAAFITRCVDQLDKGDIITHAFTDKPGGVFNMDGTPKPGLEAALARGVFLDAASGRGHINFNLARAAIQRGFRPHTIGTDVVRLPQEQPHFYNVALLASKLIALGLTLPEAVQAVTSTPALLLSESANRGSLKAGLTADISVMGCAEGEFFFHDGRAGNIINGPLCLSPQHVIKAGTLYPVRQSYQQHIPTRELFQQALSAAR